jgi:uncharacterized membrane protein YccF (DUF307 family)
MSKIGNFLWFILGGWWSALVFLFWGALLCATIIGIPVGLALFQFAKLMAFPFGRVIVRNTQVRHVSLIVKILQTIINVLWAVTGGITTAIILLIEAILCCITIIGIPVGIVLFRSAVFLVAPIGCRVVDK